MRAFQIIDVPVPRIAPGQYEAWLERCRREVIARPMGEDAGRATHAILDVVVPRGTSIDLLHLMAWVDRLVRDLKVVPDQYKFSEYGAAFSPAKAKSLDGRDVQVTIYLDIDIAVPAASAAVSLPETAAA